MRLIVDRIENGILICEKDDCSLINLNLSQYEVKEKINEGDLVYIRDNIIYIDHDGTKENKKNIDKLCEDLWDE
ncbi:DUF3006 domain-containing protein [Oceanirhabdus sp. W0125-5]|uniref:DUF3006 domain-containing protein n=1 Tax=Oceanirhabdus sp. W0125-5 TaxID=2999116 RepID=UPI0022F315AD|nr:DUF3006 domain-containing protein [Oceanirhabdus sp. W0125-5]WBW95142.1 DUF3006 domain-containing protein [Oceanirhabdus sp. W0125-5]